MICVIVMAALTGCASYATPGEAAPVETFAPQADGLGGRPANLIEQAFARRPTAKFPASVAVVRVQAPRYRSYTAQGWGTGRYSIVTTRDVEKPEQVERLAKLPQLRGIAPINRLLINGNLDSDRPLREAAAQLQADMLLVYTFDTDFTTENKIKPLSVVTLGLSPNKQVRVTTTVSAVLMDTRSGFVYGLAEATTQENRLTNSWQTGVSVDETRRSTESDAFEKLVGELETTWRNVLAQRGVAAEQPAAASAN
jgi:hypothetical protein